MDELQDVDQVNHYTVVVLEKEKDFWAPRVENFRLVTTTADHYTFAEQLSFALLLYRLKPDLVHFSMPQQPLLWFGRRVTTIHDTTLIRFENIDQNVLLYKIRKFIFVGLMHSVVARSRFVLTPTDYVKNDLDEWTHHKYTQKFVRTYEAGDMIHADPEAVKSLDGVRFLVFVGNAFPYKNVNRIIEAFARLKKAHPDLHLALAGKKDFFYQQIEQKVSNLGIDDVHILGYVSDGEKRWLYQNAYAFITASLSEGFCIPLLEAMHEGAAVLSSNASCLPEVAGDAALYFDPNSTSELVRVTEQILTDEKQRASLVEKGYRRVKDFSWKQMALETKAVYDTSLN